MKTVQKKKASRGVDSRMLLKRLHVFRYRNVVPGVELNFRQGVNTLLGKNGSGKTTLMKLISRLVVGDEDFSEEVDLEFVIAFGEMEIEFRVVSRLTEVKELPINNELMFESSLALGRLNREKFSTEVHMDAVGPTYDSCFTATFDAMNNCKFTRQGTSKSLSFPDSIQGHMRRLFNLLISDTELNDDERLRNIISISRHGEVVRFDESLSFFSRMFGSRRIGSGRIAERHPYVSITRAVDNSFKSVFAKWVPVEFILAILREEFTAEGHFEWSSASHPFMEKMAKILGFERIKAQMQVISRTVPDGGGDHIDLSGLSLRFMWGDNQEIHHDMLSYGQMRMVAFLYYLELNKNVVIADELVNGLHYDWIQEALMAANGRQIFLTSQNPLLMDHLEFESADVVRDTFILCRQNFSDEAGRTLNWGSMREDEAHDFFRAYEAGIQHVGEILQQKGLW